MASSTHLYQWRGAHYQEGWTRFQVFAPHARQLKVVLTAFGREEHCLPMRKLSEFGVFEEYTHLAAPGRTYRYLVEDCHGNWRHRTDPFGFAIVEQGHCVESVVANDAYIWSDQAWMDRRCRTSLFHEPLSIYEIHADTWKKQGDRPLTFRELAWAIVDYQKKVPFTHVQLYGILDHKNVDSWGYQTDHFFAPNRRLGSSDDFKFLVDLCHQNNIGVIIDWIPAHYKHEHDGDRSQSLHEFDGTDLFGSKPSFWGTVYFDFSKEEAKRFLMASALYWLEKMHVDGMRCDAVSPLIASNGETGIAFLKELNCVVHEQYPGILMIAEETDGFPQTTRPVYAGGLGFDVKLGIHMQYRLRNYFRTPYEQRGAPEHHYGKLLDHLRDAVHGDEQWLAAHSHDDAASGSPHRHSAIYRSIPTDDTWRRFADLRLFHAWNLLTPGFGHGIHMGDEIGQTHAWNERLRAHDGSVEWGLLHQATDGHFHRGLQECVGDLNRFYRSQPAFWKFKRSFRLISDHADNRVVGLRRYDGQGQRLSLFFNFSTMGYREYDFPLDEDSELFWIKGAKEVFNTDGVQYGGIGEYRNTWADILRNGEGLATHFRMALPPLSVVVFEETWN